MPVFAVSARADGCGCGCWFPSRVDARVDFHFKVTGPGDYSVGQLGPWYLYWPMEAHFQAPAPTGYPYWPAPMGLPPQNAAYGASRGRQLPTRGVPSAELLGTLKLLSK